MRIKNTFMASTAALLASLVIASAQNAPREERGSQGGDRPSATQNQGGSSQREQRQQPDAKGEQQRSQGQRGDRDRAQTTGEGQREQSQQGQRDQTRQGQRDQSQQGQRDQSQQGQRDQSRQGQRDQSQQGQRDQSQQGQRDQSRQGQRDQSQQGQRDQSRQGQRDQSQQGQRNQSKQGQGGAQKDGSKRDSTTGQAQRNQDRQQQGQGRDQQQDRQQQGQQRRDQQQQGQQRRQDQPQQGQQQGQREESGGRVTVTAEQQTRIRETVFSGSNVPRVDRVNFSLRVGTAIPASVRIVEVPSVLIDIHPEWRGHSYFVTGDDIVICDSSRNIVAMVPVGSSNARTGQGGSGSGVVADLSVDEIREVQLVLMREGFSVEADGRFGPRTREALIQFQRRNGLQANGQIDSRTITS